MHYSDEQMSISAELFQNISVESKETRLAHREQFYSPYHGVITQVKFGLITVFPRPSSNGLLSQLSGQETEVKVGSTI